jgi:hypothetical protein
LADQNAAFEKERISAANQRGRTPVKDRCGANNREKTCVIVANPPLDFILREFEGRNFLPQRHHRDTEFLKENSTAQTHRNRKLPVVDLILSVFSVSLWFIFLCRTNVILTK